jgi:hypothetical protein
MFYKYLDYPKLPAELEAMCLDLDNLEPNTRWPNPKNLETIQVDYPVENFSKYQQFDVPKEVIRWLAKNQIITREVKVAKIHIMYDGPKVYPHMDYPRTLATNYILTESTATTCFYRHKLIPDLKPSCRNELIHPDEIELIDSVVLEHHRWHQLDVTKIHNVENITIPRVALTLSDK